MKYKGDDLLSPDQASDALGSNVTAQGVRKRMREGALPVHYKPGIIGRAFVKRGELMALYAHKINRWKGVKQ